jgi:YXWGXW repeat-containing protein
MRHRGMMVALIGAAGLLAGCTSQQLAGGCPAIPPPQPEAIPKPPVTAQPLIWQPGHWNWSGSAFVWQPGEYVPRGGQGQLFQPGYWGSGCTWQPAHWV